MVRRILIAVLAAAGLAVTAWGAYTVGLNRGGQQQVEAVNPVSDEKDAVAADQSKGNDNKGADVFTIPNNYSTYQDTGTGFSFAYPSEWGTVSRKQNNSIVVVNDNRTEIRTVSYGVGPLFMLASSEDTNSFDGDRPVVALSKGYEKEGDKYYSRFARQEFSSFGSVAPLSEGADYFNELQVGSETILVMGNDCSGGNECGLKAVLNLKNETYPGLGVRYDGKSSFDEAKKEFETVLRTFRINQ